MVTKGADGKFVRRAEYKPFTSIHAETKDQKIALLKLLKADGAAIPMKKHVGDKLIVADVILRPYTSLDPDTGEILPGVLTYLFTPDQKEVYVTSSKSVYFTLRDYFEIFGEPHYSEEEQYTVQIVEKKGQKFDYIDIEMV